MDETILVEKAKNGDKAALSQLVNSYSGRIYNLALRILRNKEDAEDILQEIAYLRWQVGIFHLDISDCDECQFNEVKKKEISISGSRR